MIKRVLYTNEITQNPNQESRSFTLGVRRLTKSAIWS